MTIEEKFERAIRLADAMYYAAQQLTTDASHLRKATETWWNSAALDVTGELWDNLIADIDDYDYTDEEKEQIIKEGGLL